MPIFSFWIELRGPTKLWAGSVLFVLLGALIAFYFPHYFPAVEQDVVGSLAVRALGWTFLGLGVLVLVPMLATLYVRARQPGREANWYPWINFVGGLAGALAFAMPATLMFPVFFAAYLTRPNALIPSDAVAANNLWVAALFSVIGLAALVLIYILVRLKLRAQPQRGV